MPNEIRSGDPTVSMVAGRRCLCFKALSTLLLKESEEDAFSVYALLAEYLNIQYLHICPIPSRFPYGLMLNEQVIHNKAIELSSFNM